MNWLFPTLADAGDRTWRVAWAGGLGMARGTGQIPSALCDLCGSAADNGCDLGAALRKPRRL